MIILALDALDKNMVEKFNCKNLMQLEYGETDISEFKLERTVILWASFLTGKNMEKKIPVKGQWDFKVKGEQTFFNFFNSFKTIDVPAFSLKQKNHKSERELLAGYFKKKNTIGDYDKIVWKNHKKNKKELFEILKNNINDIVMVYFDLADAIGHLSFGDTEKMEKVYNELDEITKKVKHLTDDKETVLIVSDHGMKAVGRFGDHSKYGFYSCNQKLNLNEPKITDFYEIIEKMK